VAQRIRDALARKKNIEGKKMFGGIGFLLNDNLLVGVWKDSLIVRRGPEKGEEALLEPHVCFAFGLCQGEQAGYNKVFHSHNQSTKEGCRSQPVGVGREVRLTFPSSSVSWSGIPIAGVSLFHSRKGCYSDEEKQRQT
jgi:TfoX N-terminal domain